MRIFSGAVVKSVLVLAILAIAECAAAESCGKQTDAAIYQAGQKVLMLGERHGTNEFQQLAKEILCNLTKNKQLVILGLEMSHREQGKLNDYLRSEGTVDDQRKFAETPFWTAPAAEQDGRRSKAMFSLIESARQMRQAGLNIGIDAFDMDADDILEPVISDEGFIDGQRDLLMASHIGMRLLQFPNAIYFALIGGIHASKLRGNRWNENYASTAFLLGKHVKVHVISGSWVGGTVWNCFPKNNITSCEPLTLHREGHSVADKGYDVQIKFGPLTISTPQVQ